MYRLARHLFIFLAILFVMPGVSFATGKLPVFVSIVPQKYFVQQIGKDLVDVQVMVEPGASPATYEPKPKQMADLSKSKIYFAIGVPFENVWLKEIAASSPKMKVVHTDHGIEKLEMAAHHHHDDEEGHHEDEHHEEGDHHDAEHDDEKKEHHDEAAHDHEEKEHHDEVAHEEDHHEHEGLDPHIWLSPPLVKMQAQTMLEALQEADPANKSTYEANFNEFVGRIDQLDSDLKKHLYRKIGHAIHGISSILGIFSAGIWVEAGAHRG